MRLSEGRVPTLVNFWGTECAPCIAELPAHERFARERPGWRVLLVSTDAPTDAQRFLDRHPVALPVLRPGPDLARLLRSAGNRGGALPFTVVVDGAGKLCFRRAGVLRSEDFSSLEAACGSEPASLHAEAGSAQVRTRRATPP